MVDDLSEDDMNNDVDSVDGEVVKLILMGWVTFGVVASNNSFKFPASVTEFEELTVDRLLIGVTLSLFVLLIDVIEDGVVVFITILIGSVINDVSVSLIEELSVDDCVFKLIIEVVELSVELAVVLLSIKVQ